MRAYILPIYLVILVPSKQSVSFIETDRFTSVAFSFEK